MAARGPKRVVEQTLGQSIADSFGSATFTDAAHARGVEYFGQVVVDAIETFLFQDVEGESAAQEIFAFVASQADRDRLAATFRGARWSQKLGLMFARPVDHPAHWGQVRAQVVEYGAIVESSLRCMLTQNGKEAPPQDFDAIIKKCKAAGILTVDGQDCANRLRLARNRVHLFLNADGKRARAEVDARDAYRCLTTVLNDCREKGGCPPWKFGKG